MIRLEECSMFLVFSLIFLKTLIHETVKKKKNAKKLIKKSENAKYVTITVTVLCD